MMQEFTMGSLTTESYIEKELELCRKSAKPIVLMPAGAEAIWQIPYIQGNGLVVKFFVDNDINKQGTTINDIPIISLEEYLTIANDFFLLVISREVIEKQLLLLLQQNNVNLDNYTVAHLEPAFFTHDEFIPDQYDVNNKFSLTEYILAVRKTIEENFNNFGASFNLLSDELSQKTFINTLNYLLTLDLDYIRTVKQLPSQQYFEPGIRSIVENDHFVDCGAFDGDTLEAVMSFTGNRIAHYYAFEPDPEVYCLLLEKSKSFNNVSLFPNGVYKENTTLKFSILNHGGTSGGTGGDGREIPCFTLDSVLEDRQVSVIKMDLEGAEYDALIGAQNLIKSQQPFLEICVYHKLTDYFRLPLLIESFGVPYKYYMRHYSDKWNETVLYAVPIK